MAVLYVSEFAHGVSAIDSSQAQMLPQPALADQAVAIGAATRIQFSARTKAVMITTDAICSIKFGGDDVVAATTNLRLPANGDPVVFAVQPSGYLSVIANV